MRPTRPLVPLVALGAAALLLAACGSSGGSSSSASDTGRAAGSPSATPTSSAPTPSAAASTASSGTASSGTPATTAQLQKIVLQPSDLPAGYKATAADPDTDDDASDTRLATCTGLPGAPDSHKVNTAQSSDFALGDVTISSEFSSYQSESDITAAVAQLKSPKINQCLNALYKAQLAKSAGAGATVNSATVTLVPGSGGGPSNVAALASGTVDFTVQGQQAKIYVGIAFVTGPQLDGTLTFFGINKPLDTATQMSALTAVATRAQNP